MYAQTPQRRKSPVSSSVLRAPRVSVDSGQRKALLIGINYKGTSAALKGCVLDVERMKHLLCSLLGFRDSSTEMVVLRDDAVNPIYQPTRANMLEVRRDWINFLTRERDWFSKAERMLRLSIRVYCSSFHSGHAVADSRSAAGRRFLLPLFGAWIEAARPLRR